PTTVALLSPPILRHAHLPPSTPVSTLSLHDALPISGARRGRAWPDARRRAAAAAADGFRHGRGGGRVAGSRRSVAVAHRASHGSDRKSTRLNSSHEWISYAVFCLKKKKKCHKRQGTE